MLITIALFVSGAFLSAYKQAQVSPTGTKPVRPCTCPGFFPWAAVQKQHQAARQDRIQEDQGPVVGTVSMSPITTSLRNLAVTLTPRIPLPIVCNYTLLDNSVLQSPHKEASRVKLTTDSSISYQKNSQRQAGIKWNVQHQEEYSQHVNTIEHYITV